MGLYPHIFFAIYINKTNNMDKFKNFLLYIWQLPQNLLGLIMLLFMKPYVLKENYKGIKPTQNGYYKFYTEKRADRFGGVER